MIADRLLSNLQNVRPTGSMRWVARCPTHADRRPSLAVRELDDGRLLIHCFAGCEVVSVLDAIGLSLTDLFPERLGDIRRERQPFNAHDVLECLAQEAEIVAVASCNMGRGIFLEPQDHERLMVASARLDEGRRLANGER